MEDVLLSLQEICKAFGETEALAGVSLDVREGEFLTLLGPSGAARPPPADHRGAGKPRQRPRAAAGEDMTGWEPNRRPVNTVFQSYALFPHMNVAKNIGYGLRLKKTPKEEIRRRVDEMLGLVQLPGFGGGCPTSFRAGSGSGWRSRARS